MKEQEVTEKQLSHLRNRWGMCFFWRKTKDKKIIVRQAFSRWSIELMLKN